MQTLSLGPYATLGPEAGLPTALLRKDGTPIPATQISRGTAASLALAVGIALIENLLEQSGMFVLLDDPLVDLDAGRRGGAAAAGRASAGDRAHLPRDACRRAGTGAGGGSVKRCDGEGW